jgi:hypothetical protein
MATTHSARRVPAEDVLLGDDGLDRETRFCANPRCGLHVRLRDLRHDAQAGESNWVTLADGRIFGRARFGGWMLCDACGTQRGPVAVR